MPAGGTPGFASVGETIAYKVESENSGNVDVTGITITDSVGSQYTGCLEGVSNPWLVGGAFTCTPDYVIRQGDIDAGEVVNIVSITGYSASGGTVAATTSVSQALVSTGEMLVTGTTALVDSDGVKGASAGDVVAYEIELRNTGGTTLYQIFASDPLLDAQRLSGFSIAEITCAPSLSGLRLAPGSATECKATYTVTQTDVNDGSIASMLTVMAETRESPVTAFYTVSVTLEPLSSIQLVATMADVDTGEDGRLNAGDVAKYSMQVSNPGNTCLMDIAVRDEDGGEISCDESYKGSAGLEDMFCPQDQPYTCTGTHTIEQGDINSGSRTITSQISSVSPNGTEILDTTDNTVRLNGDASIIVEITAGYALAGGSGPASSVGDVIAYTLTIKNDGALTLSAVSPLNSKVDDLLCDPAVLSGAKLDAGGEAFCVGSYLVAQGDIDAGEVIGVASVTAENPAGDSIFHDTRHIQHLVQDPSISVVLSGVHAVASSDGKTLKGDTITYTAEVDNSGNTCLRDIEINELLLGAKFDCKTVPEMFCPTDEAVFCSGNYILTQENVDAGHISNTATAVAATPLGTGGGGGALLSESDSDYQSWSLYPEISVEASLSLVSDLHLPYAGDHLRFSFEVENAGTTSLTGVSVTAPLLERAGVDLGCTPSIDDGAALLVLAPGEVVICSAMLELTQADIEGALLSGTVLAKGEASDGQTVHAEKYLEQDLRQEVGLSVVEDGVLSDEDGDGLADEGETISYTTTLRNTGNVRVKTVAVSHSLAQDVLACDQAFQEGETPSQGAELLPGGELKCVATHVLTQSEVDSGKIVNTASATGTARDVDGTEMDQEDSSELALPQKSWITLSAAGIFIDDGAVDGEADDGDHMEYAFTVSNSGSTTLTDIVVKGATMEAGEVSCPKSSLAPAESMVCTASYDITAVDVGNYLVEATVTVTAAGPTGQTPTAEDSNMQRLDAQPSLTLTKEGVHVDLQFEADGVSPPGTDGNLRANFGEYIRYSMVVRNTGLVTVHAIDVVETLDGADVICPGTSLNAAESMVCSATYLVTQDDLDKGGVSNLATAAGYARNDDGENRFAAEADASSWTNLPQDASVTMEEECSWQDGAESDGLPDPGESMLLTYTISNTGSVTLLSGSLQEGDGDADAMDCRDNSGDVASLNYIASGDEIVCTSYKTITQADVDAGSASSKAAFTALSPLDEPQESAADCSWAWESLPPQIETAVTGRFVDENGDSNSAVGETVTFSISVLNDGKATTTVVALEAIPATTVLSGSSNTGRGGVATVVCDPALASSPSLAPGEALACVVDYAIKQEHVNSGEIIFDFETRAINPAGVETSLSDSSSVELPSKHRISLTLESGGEASFDGDGDGKSSAGDEVAFTLVVSNTGSVDLTDVEVQDATLEGLVCQQFVPATTTAVGRRRLGWADTNTDDETFPPNESYTCKGFYTLTQDDVDSGKVYNTASVTSRLKGSDATPVMAGAETTLILASHPSMAVVIVGKLSDLDLDNLADDGEPVVFEFTVINTGNVRFTMADIQVLDGLLENVACIDKPALLEPQGQFSCSGQIVLIQEDIDQGVVTLEVVVTATDPSMVQLSTSDVDAVTLARNLELGLRKTALYMEGASSGSADTVDYSFEVTNLGTTTLANVSVIDASLAGEVLCPSGTLVPGGSMACNSSEPAEVTSKDLTMGSIVNTATVVGKGPREDDPTVTANDTVVTLTPTGGDNPVVMSYTSVGLLPASVSRRRLEAGDDLCGVDAIVAACNKAFGVDTCRCVQHSGDGGCGPSSSSSSSSASPEAAAGDGLDIEVADEVEQAGAILEADGENDPRSPAGSSRLLTTTSSPSSAELTTTFVETEQSVITELEISFTTDEESTGAMKAAEALDSFADVSLGFQSLLVGDCFQDVLVTAVCISQADTPKDKRVPNPDISSASYLDHAIGTEAVTTVDNLDSGGSNPFKWITVFVLATALATGMCVCLGVVCVRRSGSSSSTAAESVATVAAAQRRKTTGGNAAAEHVVVDGSILDTPRSSQYKNENRMFHSPAATDARRGGGRSRLSAEQKRAALNARSNPLFGAGKAAESGENFAVLSSGSDFTGLTDQQEGEGEGEEGEELEVSGRNPMFQEPRHVPRLSALDFGRTIDEPDDGSDPAAEFWRPGARGETE